MSASDEWMEWHLTSDGWVKGSEHWDGGGDNANRPVPKDAVLTKKYWEYSGWGAKLERGIQETKYTDDLANIVVLLNKFGKHPDSGWCKGIVKSAE